jgi:hypothetical protein
MVNTGEVGGEDGVLPSKLWPIILLVDVGHGLLAFEEIIDLTPLIS